MFNPNTLTRLGFVKIIFFFFFFGGGGSFQEELIDNISLMLDNISSLS